VRTEAYFSVVGVEPAPQGSKKFVGNNRFIEASKKLEPWREAIGEAVERMFAATVDRECFAEDVPLEVIVTFIVPRPATVKESVRPWPVKAPDLDKYCRSLGDGMSLARYVNPPLIPDDAQIVKWTAEKVYGSRADMGARVAVRLYSQK
jgi:crossover junction endodeoxyribonuclease RusA